MPRECDSVELPPAVDGPGGKPPVPKLSSAFSQVFSFPVLLAFGLAALAVVSVSNRFNDPDLWWHLKVGEVVWSTHSIPRADTFSFTTNGHAWTAHEWLAQLSIYAAYTLGGYTGLMVWFSVSASLILVTVYGLCCLYSGNSRVAFLGGLIAWFFATVGLAVRPQMLGYLLLAMEVLLIELGRTRNHRWWWLLPPLFAVWVNCHGSYVLGMAILATYLLCARLNRGWGGLISEEWDRRSRRLLELIAVLCVAALCVNPVGPHLLFYPLDTLFHQSTGTNGVEEWQALDMRSERAMGMLGLLAVLFLLSLVRGSQLTVRELLLIAAVSLLAFRYTRMLFVFGIVMAPVLCRCFRSDWRDEEQQAHPVANAALMAVSLAVIVWAFPSAASLERQVDQSSPVKAVEYIRRAGLTGPMLNQYDFGGYLIWALPEEKVFVDGRADVYDWAGVLAEYGAWATLQADPLVLLNKHGIRLCVLSRTAPIAAAMRYLPGWREAYSDEVAVIFVRNDQAVPPARAGASVHESSPAPLG